MNLLLTKKKLKLGNQWYKKIVTTPQLHKVKYTAHIVLSHDYQFRAVHLSLPDTWVLLSVDDQASLQVDP